MKLFFVFQVTFIILCRHISEFFDYAYCTLLFGLTIIYALDFWEISASNHHYFCHFHIN